VVNKNRDMIQEVPKTLSQLC